LLTENNLILLTESLATSSPIVFAEVFVLINSLREIENNWTFLNFEFFSRIRFMLPNLDVPKFREVLLFVASDSRHLELMCESGVLKELLDCFCLFSYRNRICIGEFLFDLLKGNYILFPSDLFSDIIDLVVPLLNVFSEERILECLCFVLMRFREGLNGRALRETFWNSLIELTGFESTEIRDLAQLVLEEYYWPNVASEEEDHS
jgi:hypothetical protein